MTLGQATLLSSRSRPTGNNTARLRVTFEAGFILDFRYTTRAQIQNLAPSCDSHFLDRVLSQTKINQIDGRRLRRHVRFQNINVVEVHGALMLTKPADLKRRGAQGIAKWVSDAADEWDSGRGAKSEKMSLYERLDRNRDLTRQKTNIRFRVLYNTSGTYIAASTVDLKGLPPLPAIGTKPAGFVEEITTVAFATDSQDEAGYLVSILNSTVLDDLIKPMQAKGLWGERHIHQKPLELGIPRFDHQVEAHAELAALATACSIKADATVGDFTREKEGRVENLSPQVVGQLRSRVREAVSTELTRIDELVCDVLMV